MLAMAVNAAGETVIVGDYASGVTIGDVVLPGGKFTVGFVAKYDAELELMWARALALPGKFVEIGADGDVTVGSEQDLLRLDGVTGDEIWAVQDITFAMTTLADGDVVMASRVVLGDDKVARLDAADGSVVWQSNLVQNPDLALPDEVVSTAEGGIFWLGQVKGTIHTEAGDLVAGGASSLDPVLIRFDGDGVALWGRVLSNIGYLMFPELALDDCGIYVGAAQRELGPDGLLYPRGRLFRLDMAGELLWTNDLMLEGGSSEINAITTDADGNVLVAGSGLGTIAGKPLDYVSGFIAQLNRDGELLWVETLDGSVTPAMGVSYLGGDVLRVGTWSYNSIMQTQGQTILDDGGVAVVDFTIAAR
jgi:outer membrane protein assembly factor BamB